MKASPFEVAQVSLAALCFFQNAAGRSSGCWILGSVAGLGSIARGRTKPLDVKLSHSMSCICILGSFAANFRDGPSRCVAC